MYSLRPKEISSQALAMIIKITYQKSPANSRLVRESALIAILFSFLLTPTFNGKTHMLYSHRGVVFATFFHSNFSIILLAGLV